MKTGKKKKVKNKLSLYLTVLKFLNYYESECYGSDDDPRLVCANQNQYQFIPVTCMDQTNQLCGGKYNKGNSECGLVYIVPKGTFIKNF